MTGEIDRITGTPAALSFSIAARRRFGVAARGSSVMAIFGSSEVTDTITETSRFAAIGLRRSRSRVTRSDLVVIISG